MWERKNSFEKDVSSCILECLINGNAVPCFFYVINSWVECYKTKSNNGFSDEDRDLALIPH